MDQVFLEAEIIWGFVMSPNKSGNAAYFK